MKIDENTIQTPSKRRLTFTDEGQSIYGVISTGEMECPKCNKSSKEEKWNFKEN